MLSSEYLVISKGIISAMTFRKKEILSYAEKNSLKVVRTERIVESAWHSDERDDFHKAIDSAVNEGIYNVLFYMADREGRNFTDIEKHQGLIKQGKIAIHYVRDNKILDKNSSNSDFMIREFQALTDKQLSNAISAKVTDVMNSKAESGYYPGNKPPLGYILQKQSSNGSMGKGISIVVPDTNLANIKLVRREFELKAKSYSYEDIRKTIIEEGLIPHDEIKSYHIASIQRRILNPFYRGFFVWSDKTYKGKHELIIDRTILNIIDNIPKYKTPIGRATSDGIFAHGWLKCADPNCRCNIVYDPKKKVSKGNGTVKEYKFYHCTNGKRLHDGPQVNVSEDKIKEQLATVVDSISIDDTFANQIIRALNETKEKMKDSIRREMESYNYALKQLEDKENIIFDSFNAKNIDKEMYDRQIMRVREERSHYSNLLRESNIKITDVGMETAQSILELARSAKTLWSQRAPLEQRMFLDKLLSNPSLNGSNVQYELRKPFLIISKMKASSDWRTQRDSNPVRTSSNGRGISVYC